MGEAERLVRQAASEAASNDDLAGDGFTNLMRWDENDLLVPIDERTLDERAAGVWESRRRDEED
jgi:hypothetical protein